MYSTRVTGDWKTFERVRDNNRTVRFCSHDSYRRCQDDKKWQPTIAEDAFTRNTRVIAAVRRRGQSPRFRRPCFLIITRGALWRRFFISRTGLCTWITLRTRRTWHTPDSVHRRARVYTTSAARRTGGRARLHRVPRRTRDLFRWWVRHDRVEKYSSKMEVMRKRFPRSRRWENTKKKKQVQLWSFVGYVAFF